MLKSKKPLFWIAAVTVLVVLVAGSYILSYLFGQRASGSGSETTVTEENASKQLTLDEVVELSRQGLQLHWDDFSAYDSVETGSGLRIQVYPIDDMFSLWIGGTDPVDEPEPIYINLRAHDGSETSLDIRNGGVEAYIDEHQDNPVTEALFDDILASAMP